MTQLPLWAVYVVAFGTPLSALAGVLISQWLARRTAREIDSRSKREELMRNLHWAAELAAAGEERQVALGVAQLMALGESELLDPADQRFVDAALLSVIREPREEIDEMEAVGEQVEVVEEVKDRPTSSDDLDAALSSDLEGSTDEEVGDDRT